MVSPSERYLESIIERIEANRENVEKQLTPLGYKEAKLRFGAVQEKAYYEWKFYIHDPVQHVLGTAVLFLQETGMSELQVRLTVGDTCLSSSTHFDCPDDAPSILVESVCDLLKDAAEEANG